MSQTIYYAVPAELDDAFRARLRETGIEAEFGPVRTVEPRAACSALHSLSKSDGELFLTPELALLYLLASSQEVVDDFADSFSEDVCGTADSIVFAGGNPMALDDANFIRFVNQKNVMADEVDLWDKAVEDAEPTASERPVSLKPVGRSWEASKDLKL